MLQMVGRACRRLRTRGFLVGGPVRDSLLGAESPDVDVAVESGMPRLARALARELGGRFVYHRRFMTGTISDCRFPAANCRIDIAQTRTETYVRPGALPEVKPAGIDADLARRDFSINAMAREVTPGAFGRLVDPLGGRADLRRRVVRVLHERSFVDDPTRIFRAIRFATRLGCEIEPKTLGMMRLAIAARLPALLSPERVLHELRLMCREPLCLQMFEALLKERVLESAWDWQAPPALLPGLKALAERRATPEMLFTFLLSLLPVTDRFPIRREEREAAAAIAAFAQWRGRAARLRRMSGLHRLLRGVPDAALAVLAGTERRAVAAKLAAYLLARARAKP
ncbi:CCA tRNA nucleotidyltransferase, partial [candidate division WOR-3 bacterium]|nr:CCA tRNA nucleotidyltransferase [candidate division WOR-3 bacterium]